MQFSFWKLCARFLNDLFWKWSPKMVRNDQKLYKTHFPNRVLQKISAICPSGYLYFFLFRQLLLNPDHFFLTSWFITISEHNSVPGVVGNGQNISCLTSGPSPCCGGEVTGCAWVPSAIKSAWLSLSSLMDDVSSAREAGAAPVRVWSFKMNCTDFKPRAAPWHHPGGLLECNCSEPSYLLNLSFHVKGE